MKNFKLLKALIISLLLTVIALFLNPVDVYAKALDEIVDYSITVDVNDDATLNMIYDISWKVLDSDSEGPLEWVKIGIPNSHCSDIVGLTDTVSSIKDMSSGGAYVRVDFDRAYYEGEIVHFAFSLTQDYMYQYYPEENICEYSFTPGWFDGIEVDNATVRWNGDKIERFSPSALNEDGYYTWNTSLSAGEKMSTMTIAYAPEAYGFDLTKHADDNDDDFTIESPLDVVIVIIGIIFVIIMIALPFAIPALIVYVVYKATRGFTSSVKNDVTRTIIEYYPSCPNCGGTREEGKENCSYCGSSMVKSRQVVKESEIKNEDKEILKYKSNGDYSIGGNPNRYVRVNVVPVHVSAPVRRTTSGSSSHSSHHSSCAHSSCACACACACAGGGRAGCSTKDFYNTNLKLSYLGPKKTHKISIF